MEQDNRNSKTSSDQDAKTSLRLWPGVVMVLLQWLIRFVIPVFVPDSTALSVFGGLIFGLGLAIWWIFFSRAPRFDKWTAAFLAIAALGVTANIIDKSIATSMMGLMFIIYSIPVLSLAFIVWAIVSRQFSERLRRVTMVVTILLASGFWTLLRSDGMDGQAHHFFAWRWAPTNEEKLLNKSDNILINNSSDPADLTSEAEWPGFRGINRDGIVHGVQISTNWSVSPPVEMWRRSVGPGCSSFAIHGSLLYTQEQRGENEMVTCYNLKTGEPLWRHSDTTRFWDSHAGAGPRSTPTLSNGRVYTLGATGILNVLNASDGRMVWSRNVALDTDVKIPGWGYACSPLVVDSVVIVAIAGKLLAYDLFSGDQRWSGPDGGESYSSPQLLTTDRVKQVLFLNKSSATGFEPDNGRELWKLPLTGVQIIQPAVVNESDILISSGDLKGLRRIGINNESGRWTISQRWESGALKAYFNDLVVHKGHVFGLDGPSVVCVDIENGIRKWRGGHYGGQLILLADQDLLLVLTEKGDLALVSATPERFKELALFPAIKGKTWNHPVLVGNILVVRNTNEMVAFRLPKKI